MEARNSESKSSAALRSATGRDYPEWFQALDEWGAPGRPYQQIASWLTGEHGVSGWWAQKLIVEYEQARGLRPPGARPDGTFEVSATKNVSVPLERLMAAFGDPDVREHWLPGAAMRERASRRERTLRFDWEDGPSRVVATFQTMGPDRSQVFVQHERLPDDELAEQMKAFWRERLVALKAVLES